VYNFSVGAGTSLTGTDLIINSGCSLTISSAATFTLASGNTATIDGTYVHFYNGGVIPTATWASTSTLNIRGITANAPTGLAQNFGNFTWNCAGQTASVNLDLGNATTAIGGNFTVTNTNTFTIRLNNGASSSPSLTVNGNVNIGAGGALNLAATAGTTNLFIKGDLTLTSGGRIIHSSTTKAIITFNGTTNQTFTDGAIGTNGFNATFSPCDVVIASGSTLVLASNLTMNAFSGTAGLNPSLTVSGTLNCSTFSVVNSVTNANAGANAVNPTFTLSSGATIITSNSAGLTSSGATGSIQVTGTRTYSSGANYEFRGSNTGAFTTSPTANTLNNLTINRALGVTLDQSLAVAGTLTLTSGILTTTSSNLLSITNTSTSAISGASATNFISGPLKWSLPTLSATTNYEFPVGKGGTYYPMTLSPSSTTTPVITVEAFNANSGGTGGSGIGALSTTEYWNASINSGTWTQGTVSLTRQSALGSLSLIARSSSLAGTYNSLAGTVSGTSINTSNATGNTLGFFALAAPTLPEPTNQVTNLAASSVTISNIPLTWTSAVTGSQAPDGYLIKLNTGTVADPVDGTDPANVTAITSGAANAEVTPQSAAAYSSFTNFAAGTMYNFNVYSYTNTGANINFKTGSPATINHATLPNAATLPVFASTTSTGTTLSWTTPSGYSTANHSTLVFVKATSAVTAGTPTNNPTSYTANTAFGSGTAYQGDANAYCVYNGDGNNVSITGLSGSTTYHIYVVSAVDASNSNGSRSYSVGLIGNVTTPCAAASIPWTEGFEVGYTDNIAVGGCWIQSTVTGTQVWTANSTLTDYNRTPRTGSFNAFLRYTNEDWLFYPVQLTGGTNYTFEVYARQDMATSTDANITLAYGSGASSGSMTTITGPTGIIDGNYQSINGTFTPATSGVYYMGIKGYMNGTPWFISLDDISVTVSPLCAPQPSSLSSSSVSSSGATISWTAASPAPSNGYEYAVTTSATPPSSGTASSSTSVSVTSLSENTTYYIHVKSYCGGSDYSSWVTSSSFTTPCSATNVPYTQDFESVSVGTIPSCTQVIQGGSGNLWNTASNPGFGFTSMTLYYNFNATNAANTWYFLQGLNLNGGVSYRLTYRYGSTGATWPENLKIAYGATNTIGAMTNSLADHPNISLTNQSNTVDFIPSSNGLYYIGFHAYSVADRDVLFLDDISVTLTPAACTTPTAQPTSLALTPTSGTTVDGSFTASASADNYLVIRTTTSSAPTNPTNGTTYTAGSAALGGTVVASGSNTTFSDAGLSPNTQYWYWVYAFNADNCSAGPAYRTSSPLTGNSTTPNVKTWVGYGTATGDATMTDFNASANWSPATAPSSSDNLVMNFTSSLNATITLSSNTSINSLTITDAMNSGTAYDRILNIGSYSLTIAGNLSITNSATNRPATDNITIASGGSLSVGGNLSLVNTNSSTRNNIIEIQNSGTMTVTGTTLLNTKNGTSGAKVRILVDNSPAECTFNGNVTLDDGTSTGDATAYVSLRGIVSTSTGSYVFKNNLIIGPFASTGNTGAVTFLFDGTSTQTVTDNASVWYFLPGDLTIGSTNNPTVTITPGLSSGLIFPQNNITLNGSSTLVIKSGETLNNWDGSGALTLNGTSTLKLEGTTGGQTGSNFPSFFTSYSFSTGSTVEYYGGTQTVFATPTYGNLAISTSGTKTAGGNLNVVGNTTVNSLATLAMSTFTQNISGNFINNGVFSGGTGTVNFTGSAATQTISGTGALNFSKVAFNKTANNGTIGTVNLNNNVTISGVLTFNNGNLNLNGKTLTYSGGTISTSSGIIGSTTSSKLKFTASSQIPSNLFQSDIYDLEISGASTNVTSDAEFTIANDLIVGSQSTLTLSAGFAVTMKGNITNNGTINGLGTSSELIFDKDGDQSVTGAALIVGSIKIDKLSGNLTLNAPLQVKGTLTMTKGDIITTTSNILEIGSSATSVGSVSWATGTVRGPMKRWFAGTAAGTIESGIFPVGVQSGAKAGTNRYAQVNFASNPGTGGYIVAEYKTGAPSQVPTGLPLNYSSGSYPQAIQNFEEEGYWDITPYNAAGQEYQALNSTPYTLKLRLQNPSTLTTGWSPSNDGNDLYNASTIRMIRAKGSNNHANWELAGTHVSATETGNGDYFITSSGITEFSWFNGGGNDQNPLPVELLNFNGTCEEGMVNLVWQTASEFNSSHFDVEKSTDGETWRVLATIPSAGTSNELLTYQTVDNNGTNGSNYYRLRQVDIDGKEKLYDPINVSCAETTVGYFTSYPNPSGNEFQVIVNNKEILGACTLNIVDAQGKVIDQRSIEVKDGINMFVISETLNPGIYFLNITNGTKTTQVIKHSVK
jgi:hypothetical protein